MFDAQNPNVQLLTTRTLQSIANINTRNIVELLAQGPRALEELHQFVDITRERLHSAMQVLREVRLVSERKSSEGTVYVFDRAGLDLVRAWLDRVESIVVDRDHSKRAGEE
jgi:hypothetical protein